MPPRHLFEELLFDLMPLQAAEFVCAGSLKRCCASSGLQMFTILVLLYKHNPHNKHDIYDLHLLHFIYQKL